VRCAAAEERSGGLAVESFCQRHRGTNPVESESSQKKWMMREEPDRAKNFVEQRLGVARERLHQVAIRSAIVTKARRRFVDRELQHRGAAVVERMRDRERRVQPDQSMFRQRQRFEKRRHDAHRMDGRADVVFETGQRQLLGARAAADGFLCFEHEDVESGPGQDDGGGEAVGSGADDASILHGAGTAPGQPARRQRSDTLRRVPNLSDPSPQARRIAAIALGKRGGAGSIAALRTALAAEEVAWVRPSMILALGRIGGDEARAALAEIEPRSDSETEALRKARDRVSGPATGFAWREVGLESPTYVFCSVPIGLEDVAIAEARERGIEATAVRRGTIRLTWVGLSSPTGRAGEPDLRCRRCL
jgi:hypothetical protein